jgi:hypothetical protein
MTPEQAARSVIPSPSEIASYEGEQATRAYAIKQGGEFRWWLDYERRTLNYENTKPHAREIAANKAKVYAEAVKAMDEVVRLLDETRAARMAAKGLPQCK